MRVLKILVLSAFLTLPIAAAPIASSALTSYYGANYAYDYSNATGVTICDMENDSNGAYVEYTRTNDNVVKNLKDGNGSQPGCSSSGIGPRLVKHKVCEDQFLKDPCGSYQYP